MCFSPHLGIRSGGGGGPPKGLVHNLLMQFFTIGSSKIEVFKTYFFDTLIPWGRFSARWICLRQ